MWDEEWDGRYLRGRSLQESRLEQAAGTTKLAGGFLSKLHWAFGSSISNIFFYFILWKHWIGKKKQSWVLCNLSWVDPSGGILLFDWSHQTAWGGDGVILCLPHYTMITLCSWQLGVNSSGARSTCAKGEGEPWTSFSKNLRESIECHASSFNQTKWA